MTADVRDRDRLVAEVQVARPSVIFHLAAQAIVRRAYADPHETFETNIMGTVNILEAARACPSVRAVVIVTSDKCYENHELDAPFRETDAMGGRDPYSASKGCAELVTAAYRDSFFGDGVGLASVRAGNVIGGGDWAADRIVPDCVRALTAGEPVTVRNPDAVRPWQHVLEPLSGYLQLGARLARDGRRFAGPWNFGPAAQADERSVRWVVERFIDDWGSGSWTTPVDVRDAATRSPPPGPRQQQGTRPARLGTGLGCTGRGRADGRLVPRVLPCPGVRTRPGPGSASRLPDGGGPRRAGLGGCPAGRLDEVTDTSGDPRDTRTQILELVGRYYHERHASAPFDPDRDPVRYAGRVFGEDELRRLVDASLDFYLTAGRFTEEFEAGVADYLGLSDALFVNSGSSANLVALTALTSPKLGDRRLRPGDEVITVAAGFPSTVAPIVQNGLIPVFVDVRLGDYNADPDQLRAADLVAHAGDHARAHARRAGRSRHGDRSRREARSMVRRGQLRRLGIALPRPTHGDIRAPGHVVLLPGPPHHHRRGRDGRDGP